MPFSKSGVMGARIGSVTLLVLLIGLAQYCQASRDQPVSGLTSEASSTKTSSVDTTLNTTGANEKSSSGSTATSSKGESEDFETDAALDEFGHIKFQNIRATVQEGVLDAPSPSPSSAFSILPSLVTPAVALSLSFAVLAAKAL